MKTHFRNCSKNAELRYELGNIEHEEEILSLEVKKIERNLLGKSPSDLTPREKKILKILQNVREEKNESKDCVLKRRKSDAINSFRSHKKVTVEDIRG